MKKSVSAAAIHFLPYLNLFLSSDVKLAVSLSHFHVPLPVDSQTFSTRLLIISQLYKLTVQYYVIYLLRVNNMGH